MRYEAPNSIDKAVELLAAEKGLAFVLAGGTDLLVRMKGGFSSPTWSSTSRRSSGCARSGGRRRLQHRRGRACAELGENKALKKAWPGVVEAANLIGSNQIQGRCTITGNLCNASPAADSVPALVAAGARASIVGPEGPAHDAGRGRADRAGQDSLAKGEIIEAILLDRPPRRVRAMPICASFRAPRWISRWSAPA